MTSPNSFKKESGSFLFIGGAPRSGTTLLMQLLDNHPEMLTFASEHKTFERFFEHQDDIETFASDGFINDRRAGQQTLLANRSFFEFKQQQLKQEYGKDFEAPVNFEKFKSSYLDYIRQEPASLDSMLRGLAFAQYRSAISEQQLNLQSLRYLAFKQPFFTELFAQETAKLVGGCRFIHIVRNPMSRYVSAKTRRLSHAKSKGRRLCHINRLPYPEGHALIDAASSQLMMENLEALGKTVYRVVHFEDLVQFPKNEIEKLLDWLGISPNEFEIAPTIGGVPMESGSTYTVGKQVDGSAANRSDTYLSNTTPIERKIHRDTLSAYSGAIVNRFSHAAALLVPLPLSSWKNYLLQLRSAVSWLTQGSPLSVRSFLQLMRKGKGTVNGGT